VNLDVYRLMELSPDEVRAKLGLAAGSEVVAYCHSGGRSAIATQVLRSLGYDARNYVGSWHEWSRHDDLPVES
jgi:thiosulfate/3-mercaptopyruvate sulfurtransferase